MSKKYPGGLITAGSPAGYSVAFDGTGDYLSIPYNISLSPGSGDFTVEAWVYFTAFSTTSGVDQSVIGNLNGATGAGDWGLYYRASPQRFEFSCSSSGAVAGLQRAFYAPSTFVPNKWYNLIGIKSGSTLSIYVDGIKGTDATLSTVFNSSTATLIGVGAGVTTPFAGYISNIRVVKGFSLYSGATITTPTQLFNVAGTSLLTCNSPAIVDQSSNAFTITSVGDAKVSTFTPFISSDVFYNNASRTMVPSNAGGFNPAYGSAAPGVWTLDQAQYNTANRLWPIYDPQFYNTTLYLPANGTNGAQNNTFLDSSANNFTITRNGNTTQGTFTPFSQTGWSNYFDGTGDCLTYTITSNKLDPGSAFTIDGWFYGTSTGSNQVLFVYGGGVQGFNATNGIVWQLYRTSTNQVVFVWFTGGTTNGTITVTNGFVNDSWNHIAVSFNGTTTRVWCNGVVTSSATTTYTLPTTRNEADVCGNLSAAELFIGYASNVRFVSGSDLYGVSNLSITVPTSALTTSVPSGTVQLLCCNSNNFNDQSSNAFAITVNGNPQVQAFSPFYPTQAYTPQAVGGSAYFDGTGDYLQLPASAGSLGAGDFTVEAWIYPTSTAAQTIFAIDGTSRYTMSINVTASQLSFYDNTTTTVYTSSGADVRANQWNHIAWVRSSGSLMMFVNGARYYNAARSTTFTASSYLRIGASITPDAYFVGYMCARITSGALYTAATYTVPTAPFTTSVSAGSCQLLTSFTNGGIIDQTAKNVLETVGNAQISTAQSKWGGSSIFFNGTTDRLGIPKSPAIYYGAADFTVEAWVYTTSLAATQTIAGFGCAISTGYCALNWRISATTGGLIAYVSTTGSSETAISGGTIPINTWTHVSLVRVGSTITQYVNGISVATGTVSGALYAGSVSDGDNRSYSIGCYYSSSSPGNFFVGYMDDFRITRYARYTSNFIPPTSQLQQQ